MWKLASDIRFWILLFFLVRMYGITNPPLDRAHAWREVSTNMYARNFLEIDNRPWYGRVDMAGDLSGITAKEFPVLNYGIYLISEVFGFQHWYGRLINLLISSIGLYFFYLILLLYFDKRLAFTSTIVLACSIWWVYSRMIIPDTFSISLVLIGSYYGLRFFKEGRRWDLLWYGLWAGLGVLSKIPSIYFLGIFILPFFQKETSWNRRLLFLIPSAFILAANGFWYGYWVPHIVATYGYNHHVIKTFSQGFSEAMGILPGIAYRFYGTALYSYIAFGFFVLGVFFMFKHKNKLLQYSLLLLSILFSLVVIKAGVTFKIHSYYVAPFVPVMSLLAGYGIVQVLKHPKWQALALLVIFIESGANQMHHFWLDDWQLPKKELEQIADTFSETDDLFVALGDGSPILLYFAHRKGWAQKKEAVLNPEWRTHVIDKGAKYLIIDKKIADKRAFSLPYGTAYEDDHFLVFDLLK